MDLFKAIIRILLTLTFILSISESANIARNGGYDVVIAIDENTPPPANVQSYRENIQNAFHLFSMALWRSTRQKFFINSVDVLIPNNWETAADIATFQAYATADFKVSNAFEVPRVENFNPCGSVGQYIEIPLDFFNHSRLTTNYGESAKALLNLFARYRFGVWEEHGEIAGNERFPYFHMKASYQPKWEVTGCSSEIDGKIVDEFGENSDDCDDHSATGPEDKCRFIPSKNNKINSSLTFLPWATSVEQFCDEHTHSYEAPNRQNLFCGHRSVWEVIRESEDYFTVIGKPSDSLAVPKFRVYKTSLKPLFYLLLDRGRTSTSLDVLQEVTESLQDLLNSTFLNPEIIATVGTFPHPNTGRNHYYTKEEAPWSTILSGSGNFSSVIEETISHHEGPVIRDFGEAIKEVVEKIKARNHKAGAVILIVKRGATQNNFEQLTYFGDVLSSVREQSNIHLFAIEFQQNEKTPYVNLQPLVEQANGRIHIVNDTTDVRARLAPLLNDVKQLLEQGVADPLHGRYTVFKGFVPVGSAIEIPILDQNLESVTLCLTTKRHIAEEDIEIRQVFGTPATVQKTRKDEWNEVADKSKRAVTIVKILSPEKDSIWQVRINKCASNVSEDCVAFLVANADGKSSESIISSNLVIDVYTSAENNYLDFDRRGAKIVPFTIFGQIELNGQRVLGLEKVTATIVRDNREYWTIPLLDDGSFLPDVSHNDGIYSGIFTPPADGIYKIYIAATHHRVANEILEEDEGANTTVNSLGRLIAVDQAHFSCRGSNNKRCSAATISGSLSKTADMIGTIYVAHSITFWPRPLRILDFTVETLPGFKVQFNFTSPRILGTNDSPDEYHILMAQKIEDFVGGTDLAEKRIIRVGDPPGTRVTIEYDATNDTVPFYAVEAVYRDQKGGPSNVIGVVITENGVPPSPEPTTTTTTTSTTTTTTETSTTTETPPETSTEAVVEPTTPGNPTPTTTRVIPTTTQRVSDSTALHVNSRMTILTAMLTSYFIYKYSF